MSLFFERRRSYVWFTVAFLLAAARSLAADAPVIELPEISWPTLPIVQPHVPSPDVRAASRDVPRPRILVPLYATFAATEILDVHSTYRAQSRGGVEANPFLSGLTGSPAVYALVKGASFAGIVVVTEKLRKRHPLAAVLTMVALNAGYAAVVAHNYTLVR